MMIMRRWTGRVRSGNADEYVAYVVATGGDEYRSVPGNLGYQVLRRDLGNDETEISTVSWWSSWDAIKAFAGPEPALARYYPEDERWLIHRPERVEHFDVVAGSVPGAMDDAADRPGSPRT
jgi:heme-degrading monooxygenase HmoA